MNMVKVALAEDNVLLREGISRLVAANKDFELVGVASDLPPCWFGARPWRTCSSG